MDINDFRIEKLAYYNSGANKKSQFESKRKFTVQKISKIVLLTS